MTLKEFEQEGEEEYESNFAWIFGHCCLGDEDKKELLNWHNQRTQKAYELGFDAGGKTVGGTGRTMYELGQQEMLAMVLKEIEETKTKYLEDSSPLGAVINGYVYRFNQSLDTLKEKLQSKQ